MARYTTVAMTPASAAAMPSREGPRLSDLLRSLARQPQQLVRVWNWKSALFSVCMRGPIFFAAAWGKGAKAALGALLLETVICAVGVGLYNALVQTLRRAQPLWLTGILLSVIFPGCVQAVEYLSHRAHGTPHLRTAALVSLCVSGTATLFNWYAMRQGALLVGSGSRGLLSDLSRVPWLVVGFVTAGPRMLARRLRPGGETAAKGKAEPASPLYAAKPPVG